MAAEKPPPFMCQTAAKEREGGREGGRDGSTTVHAYTYCRVRSRQTTAPRFSAALTDKETQGLKKLRGKKRASTFREDQKNKREIGGPNTTQNKHIPWSS